MSERIRPAETQDLGACAAIVAGQPLWTRYCYNGPAVVRDLSSALEQGDRVRVAIDTSGEIVGFTWVSRRGAFGRGDYLRLIAIAHGKESHELGASLLEEAYTASSAPGGVFLMVSDFNKGARRFYKRHGFSEIGSLPDFVLSGVAEIVMWRPQETSDFVERR